MTILTIDLHTHLLEMGVKPNDYWKQVKERGLNAVAITEHVEEDPVLAYYKLVGRKPKDVLLIPGMELNTNIGHVVALGSSPKIYEEPGFLKVGLDIEKALRLAKKHGVLLSISHPWGFSHDSAAYIIGERQLEKFVEANEIGVETFNGMIGHIENFVFGTNWVKRPLNFFDFLEKNKVAKKTRLDKIGTRLKETLGSKSKEAIERCVKPVELGKKAAFVTAGSDAHYPNRIGSGILKLSVDAEKIDNRTLLDALSKKDNVVWSGPGVTETIDGDFKLVSGPPSKKEVILGLKYAAISKGKKGIVKIGKRGRKEIVNIGSKSRKGIVNIGSKIRKRIKRNDE
ncbi:MAG: PHP domain-containing protein [archaeon]|nr:PHP domain-containing protein [archaeon]